jgi:hypothetical protein
VDFLLFRDIDEHEADAAQPLFHGSTVASARPVATAASTALPPALSILTPASPAILFCVATTPPRERASGLRTRQFWTRCSDMSFFS